METLEVSGISLDGSLNESRAPLQTSTPVKSKTQRVMYLCGICSQQYLSQNGLRSHSRLVHEKNATYKCKICSKMFMSNQHFIGHMNIHSKLKPYKCLKCKVQFAYTAGLSDHKKVCENGDPSTTQVRCDQCNLEFKTAKYLKDHNKSVHSSTLPYWCECGRRFKWRSSLKKLRDTTCVAAK